MEKVPSAVNGPRFLDSGHPLPYKTHLHAGMAELVDAADSKSAGRKPLGVRVPLPVPE